MTESAMSAAKRVDEQDRASAIGGAGAPLPEKPKLAVVEPLPAEAAREMVTDRPLSPEVIAAQAEADVKRAALLEAVEEDEDWAEVQALVGRLMKRGGRNPLEPFGTDSRAMRTFAEIAKGIRLTKRDAPDAVLLQAIERGQAVARALAGGAA